MIVQQKAVDVSRQQKYVSHPASTVICVKYTSLLMAGELMARCIPKAAAVALALPL